MTLSLDVKFNQQQLDLVRQIPIWVRHAITTKAARAMAPPIKVKAKAIAPSSRNVNPGNRTEIPTREKWGKKYKNNPKWTDIDSGKHVGHKVLTKTRLPILLVGFDWPMGNKQQFNASKAAGKRREVFWGRPAGTIYKPPKGRVMDRAWDETSATAINLFVNALEAALKEEK